MQYIPLHLIEEFTNHFSDDNKIGHGTFGDVYKGIYKGEVVAVKKLRVQPEQDDENQFKNEFENIVRIRHENIVRLIAYSYEAKYKYVKINQRLFAFAAEIYRVLCFEYLQNGSLEQHLYDQHHGLDWLTRYKIIKGICEALKYLHKGLDVPLLHLDLKPGNILLDKNMVPKLADFGSSKFFREEQIRVEPTQFQQSAVGTMYGYMPPEYIDRNVISEKFDIFSLGVIIIKIMTGSQGYCECNGTSPRDEAIDLVQRNWRKRLQGRAAYTALDEECHQVKTCIEIALDCVHPDPEKRPKIVSIVQRLNETEKRIEKLAISNETEKRIEKLAISVPRDSRNNPASHANMIPIPTALIQVNPKELCYRYPVELNKNLASVLQLTNMTDEYVAYIFVVSGQLEYSSTRAKGIISPRSTWEVNLNMKPHNTASLLQHEDKVILRSTIVSKDLKPIEISLDMFKQTDRIVYEVKLDVIVAAPTPSEVLVQEEFGKQLVKQQSHQELSVLPGHGHQWIAGPFKMLDVQPLELRFPFGHDKVVPCSVHLTNLTDKHVAFRLTEKSDESGCFVELPQHGILPPGSFYTLVVTTKRLKKQPEKRDYDLILQSCLLGDKHAQQFENQSECDQFFTEVKELRGVVREVAMKAYSQEKPSEILTVEDTHEMNCLDVDPTTNWIMIGYDSGHVCIGNYERQVPVHFIKVSNTPVSAVKFIARKRWFIAGSYDGFLRIYDYGTNISNKKKSWKACGGFITSLAVHPTKPYVLSSANDDPIKLWNWEEGWECTRTFQGHSDLVRQLVFNPMDTDIFASASDDQTVKVWKLDSLFPEYTLDGHSGKVTCLDYFFRVDHQYLISGSIDQTAKIWDLQKKMCLQTLDAFLSPLTCVSVHPNVPIVITGSGDGILHLWSSSNFRLERVLKIASNGDVRGVGCLMASRRAVIGQRSAISVLSMDSMNYHEAPEETPFMKYKGAPGETVSKITELGSRTESEVDSMAVDPHASKNIKKAAKSEIWQHFCMIQDKKNNLLAKCRCCSRFFKANSKLHGTSHLWRHLNSSQCNTYKMDIAPTEGIQQETQSKVIGTWKFDQDELRAAFAKTVIEDEQSFCFGEEPMLRKFKVKTYPRVQLPARRTCTRDIVRYFFQEKEKLKKFFKDSCQMVSLTMDCCTSKQEESYMIVTASFIDDDWRFYNKIIGFFMVKGHKSDKIGKNVMRCMSKWGLERVMAITVDNASANDSDIGYVRRQLVRTNLANGKYLHMRCAAHIVNLIVQEGLKEVDLSVKRVRAAICYIINGGSSMVKFKKLVEEEKLTNKPFLKLDVPTRWNSSYLMLKAAVIYKKVFTRLADEDLSYVIDLSKSRDGVGHPVETDWQTVQMMTDFLEHFHDLSVRVSARFHITSHTLFHEIGEVHLLIQSWLNSTDALQSAIGRRMKYKFDKYWGVWHTSRNDNMNYNNKEREKGMEMEEENLNLLIFVAGCLDPRYKLSMYTKITVEVIFGEARGQLVWEAINTCIHELFEVYSKIYAPCEERTDVTAPIASKGERRGKLKEVIAKRVKLGSGSSNNSKSELHKYLAEEIEDTEKKLDLLLWWKASEPRFPVLSRLARDVLAIPISAVPLESAFNTSGHILDDFRSSLTPFNLQALVCTQDWLRWSVPLDMKNNIEELTMLEKELIGNFCAKGEGEGKDQASTSKRHAMTTGSKSIYNARMSTS